ncbi:Uncharacterised protein [Candidatus Bilamarchaeum dharawalense]|uniref:Uncharacterized protein n=1 Tax=Candidatus Bilamarchaeum dharawalense TaxID=2885759 RepID=A0A5E4LRQ9_9ARCH|nr:Uncharacterised protein [Candidatus Bilamarchaeum dharawalense]
MAIISAMWQDWVWVAGAVLSLSTILVAIVYFLSELFINEKMKNWAKMELAEIFYSAIIISMGITGLPLVDAVVQGSLGVSNMGFSPTGTHVGCTGSVTSFFIPTTDYGTVMPTKTYQCKDICGPDIAVDPKSIYHDIESCHMRLGIWYMREVFDEAKNFAFNIYLSYIGTSMLAQFTINIEFIFEKAGFFTFTPWAGFYTMGNKIKELCFDWAMKLLMLTKFQEVLLRFIATAVFPAFFVIGAILRAFPLTRKLGGLMLGMAIALYFIYPAFYAFGALLMLDIKNDPQVQLAWLSSPANPAALSTNPTDSPGDYPDPPIANSMYIRQNMSTLGGTYETGEVMDQLRDMEGKDSGEYFKEMEAGALASGQKTTPGFDMSKRVTATEDEKQQKIEEASKAADDWFGTVSKENKADNFIGFAFETGGPLDTLARLTFWSVFFALFSILGTIAAIRSLSITFGGDIEIAGLTRLI